MADLVFAPYFTKDIRFHQHDSSNNGKGGSKPNDYNQMKDWYESVKRLNLSAVIFHNELSEDFITKYQTDKIKFFRWLGSNRPSYNDERFYAYYQFLICKDGVERVLCTDLYDVVFYRNPFELIDKETKVDIFVGSEISNQYSAKWMMRKCKEMNFPSARKNYTAHLMYNAGIIGGTRDRLLLLFTRMISKFNTIEPKFNANMPVFNYCMDELHTLNIFTGFPLHNIFKSNEVIDGTYIKHK